MPPGANLVCTITNEFTNPPNGHLIVIKHVINHYLGTGTAGDFLITVQGKTAQPGVDCSGRDVQVNEGTFSVGEGAYKGYTASYPGTLDRGAYCGSPNNTLVASDCTSGPVFVPRGATKYCVVVNEDNAVSAQGRMTGGSDGIAVATGFIARPH